MELKLGENIVPPEDFPQVVGEMLSRHDATLARLAGHIVGLNRAIDMLIVTHPDPRTALATWQANLPRQVDEDMTSRMYAEVPFREGVQGAMALVSRSCENAVAR